MPKSKHTATFEGRQYAVHIEGANVRVIYPALKWHPFLDIAPAGMRYQVTYNGHIYWARKEFRQRGTRLMTCLMWVVGKGGGKAINMPTILLL